jgi:hypothetical protein
MVKSCFSQIDAYIHVCTYVCHAGLLENEQRINAIVIGE